MLKSFFFLSLPETSVADRRKMFEPAAGSVGSGASQNAISRSDLRQVQQEALAKYMERRRGVRKDEGAQRSISRPRSAYFQPENVNHAGGCRCLVKYPGRKGEE